METETESKNDLLFGLAVLGIIVALAWFFFGPTEDPCADLTNLTIQCESVGEEAARTTIRDIIKH